MQRIELPDFYDFEDICLNRKNLSGQFGETDTQYDFYAVEGILIWHTSTLKGTAEAEYFEDNWKDLFNFAVGQYTAPFAQDSVVCAFDGIEITEITASSTQKLYYKIEEDDLFLQGGESGGENIGVGDWFRFTIVDHDNLLGYGVDFELKEWVKKKFLRADGCICQTNYAGNPPKDFYLCVEYHRVGSYGQANPKLWIEFFLHKKVI